MKIYKVKKLKDCVSIKGRIGWKGLKKSESGKNGILIINGPEIFNGIVNWEKCLRVPEWRYDESPEIMVQEKNILMTKDGTIGKLAFVDKLPEKATLASGVFRIESKTLLLPEFLFYYFQSKEFKELVVSRTEGSVIPHLYQRDIEELEVPVPPIEEQKKIAEILFSLDLKVKLNQRMNITLEAVGQAIFKRWFVDFEFPNEEGKPYKSSGGEMVYSEIGEIPKDWKISTIGKLASSTNYGYTQSSSSTPVGPKFLRITDIQEGKIDWATVPYCEIGQDDSKYSLKSGDIVVARTGASTGENAYIEECPKSVFASYLIRIRFADKNLARYIAKFMRSTRYQDYIEGCIGGSAQPNANAITLTNIQVAVPPNNILQMFGSMAGTLELAKYKNTQESNTLAMIRDLLLPKFMSGKIRVPIDNKMVRCNNV